MRPRRHPVTASRKSRLERIRRACEQRGVPLTESRHVIVEALLDLKTHPTADEVHAAASRRDPGIGRATVYRALEQFVRIGVLTKVSHPGAAVRYDAVVDRHHHLICLECNGILDISDPGLDEVSVPDTSSLGFVVSDMQVQLRGVCRSCLQKEEKS